MPNAVSWSVSVASNSMARTSKNYIGLVLGGVLLVGPLMGSSRAQDGKRLEANPSYPGRSEIAFEWQYSCPSGRGCSFDCGSGGANNVTKLAIHLLTIRLGTEDVAGIFYEYSTVQIPRANGFSITTGISRLSCQVSGMDLNYSGSPNNKSPEATSRGNSG
jgi:hypothetical protein